MRKGIVSLAGIGLLIAVLAWAGVGRTEARRQAAVASHRLDADKIGDTAGTKATTTKDGVVRISWLPGKCRCRIRPVRSNFFSTTLASIAAQGSYSLRAKTVSPALMSSTLR